ncbi:MAG: insulinase family protein [Clostridiaceae bacterium]|nr:insulinase family protein [Clostridiaceae bacterium]
MEKEFNAGQAVKADSFNGIDIYRIDTDKFKTSSIHIFFHDNLTRENVTKNALLPAVMRRGSKAYPSLKDISMELENLYGASFDCGVSKKGERHLMHFYIEFLSKKYTPDGTDTFEAGLRLLSDIVTRPAFVNGVFNEEHMISEKDKLRILIEGRVNDKMSYSMERCLEEVCRHEPYGIYDYGFVEDLAQITAEELTRHYVKMVETFPMQVFLTGNISDAEADRVAELLRGLTRKDTLALRDGFTAKVNVEPRYVTETMNVTQGKLCLGYRTNTPPGSQEYRALMIYSGILGGGTHSKLFQNVREKAGLAYYSHAMLEKFKGLMVISSGIDIKDKDRTMEIIEKQLDDISNGNISDREMDATLKSMETGIKSLTDSQIHIVDFYLSQMMSGTSDSFGDVIKKIRQVKREDVIRAAQKITLDTVYFLTAPEDGQQAAVE